MKIKKLDSLRRGSREMERGRWEGQNFEEEEEREGGGGGGEEEEEEEGDIHVVLVE
jgi:hypothetical protein